MTAIPSSRDELSAFLRRQIDRAKALRTVHRSDPQGNAKRRLLREWQQQRLSRTYRDLLDSPRYGPAAEFFLSDLYGLKDTSARDAAVERLYPTMVKLLPEAGLHSIGFALELDALSEELDAQLLDALEGKLAPHGRMPEADYCEAYRRCDNYALRKHQIELFRGVGDTLARAVEKPLVYSAAARDAQAGAAGGVRRACRTSSSAAFAPSGTWKMRASSWTPSSGARRRSSTASMAPPAPFRPRDPASRQLRHASLLVVVSARCATSPHLPMIGLPGSGAEVDNFKNIAGTGPRESPGKQRCQAINLQGRQGTMRPFLRRLLGAALSIALTSGAQAAVTVDPNYAGRY